MKQLTGILGVLLLASVLSACSGAPAKYGNSPDQQRRNADEAQKELSNDVSRGAR